MRSLSSIFKDIFENNTTGFFGFAVNTWATLIGRIFTTVSEGLAGLTGGTIDLAGMFDGLVNAPINFWMASHFLVFVYGFFAIMAIGFVASMTHRKPLSGEAVTAKIGTFILCLFGYTVPVLNLIPWVSIWTWVVWKNPE